MALSFPSPSSPIAAFVDPAHVAEAATRLTELPTISELKFRGRANTDPAVKRIFSLALLADDSIALVSVGRRGGHKIEWNFGKA